MDFCMLQLPREETAGLQLEPTAHGFAWDAWPGRYQPLPQYGCESEHHQFRIHLQSHQEPSNGGMAETEPAKGFCTVKLLLPVVS